jgi:hypothetical protein
MERRFEIEERWSPGSKLTTILVVSPGSIIMASMDAVVQPQEVETR